MKRLLTILAGLSIAVYSGPLGDANSDGDVDINDAMDISKFTVGLATSGPIDQTAADVNCDDKINSVDAMLVSLFYVDAMSVFPCDAPLGDVNGDGKSDIVDARAVALASVHLDVPAPFYGPLGDVDCDGQIDIVDSKLISEHYVGQFEVYPCKSEKGDVNLDGKVDIVDAMATSQASVGNPTGFFYGPNADVDGDARITAVDYGLISQFYVQLITVFPVNTSNGDVNLDGVINEDDASAIAAYSMGNDVSPFYAPLADANCDGTIDFQDTVEIGKFLLDPETPLVCPAE